MLGGTGQLWLQLLSWDLTLFFPCPDGDAFGVRYLAVTLSFICEGKGSSEAKPPQDLPAKRPGAGQEELAVQVVWAFPRELIPAHVLLFCSFSIRSG